jgi:hypothetical protein
MVVLYSIQAGKSSEVKKDKFFSNVFSKNLEKMHICLQVKFLKLQTFGEFQFI